MGFRRMILAALLLAATTAAPVQADDLFYEPTRIGTVGTVLVDNVHDQLIAEVFADGYVSQIATFDLDGSPAAVFDRSLDFRSMSPDSQRLWGIEVAGEGVELVAYSTATFAEEYRIAVDDSISVIDMVETAGKLIISNRDTRYPIYVYDLASGGPFEMYTDGPLGQAELSVSRAKPGLVAAITSWGLHLLDVSGPNPVVVANRSDVRGDPFAPVFSPDGEYLVAYDGMILRSSDLGGAGRYGRVGQAVFSGDGTRIVLGASVFEVGVFEPFWEAPQGNGLVLNHDGSEATLLSSDNEAKYLHILSTDYTLGTIRGVVRDTRDNYLAYQRVEVYDESFNYLGEVVGTFDSLFWLIDIKPRTYHFLFRNGDNPNVDRFFESWYGGAPLLRPEWSVPVVLEDGGELFIEGEVRPLFEDVEDSVFRSDIFWMAEVGITAGCNPPISSLYCPDSPVTRGQMAAFLVRALGLHKRVDVGFTDDDFSIFEADIEKLAAAGITKGCNPPFNTMFCPDDVVTRGQMAAFLHRALGDVLVPGEPIEFDDDDLSVFEADIEWFGSAGVTRGCNPPENTMFCPDAQVTRGQMAAFLRRALG